MLVLLTAPREEQELGGHPDLIRKTVNLRKMTEETVRAADVPSSIHGNEWEANEDEEL